MQANESNRDYMLIAHPAGRAPRPDDGSFKSRFARAVEAAQSAWPEIEWRAGFVLGPTDCVEIFRAPGADHARKVLALVGSLGKLRAELVPLKSRW